MVVGLRPEQLQAEQPGDKQPELFDIHVIEFGLDRDQVAAGLGEIFGIDVESARRVADSTPVLVRRAVSPAEADRFLDALKVLGAVTVLMPSREAIEQAMAQLEQSGAGPEPQRAALENGPSPLGRLALKTGLEHEPAWDSDLRQGVERVPAADLEWNPLAEGGPSTLATLSLPRAPPPLLTRQAMREAELEAPPPLLDPSERASTEPEPLPSHTRPAEPQTQTVVATPAATPEWMIGEAELELPPPRVQGLELAGDLVDGASPHHGEPLLDASDAPALDLEVDRFGQGNAHLPVQIGKTLSAAPAPPRAPPPPPPPAAMRAAMQPAQVASHALLDELPPLIGELPPLPSLPPLPGSGRQGVLSAPPSAPWLTGSPELPMLGAAPAGGTQGRSGLGKASAQDLRRELQTNRFAMGDDVAPALPSLAATPPLASGGGLELDAPVVRKTRREAEPTGPTQTAGARGASPAAERARGASPAAEQSPDAVMDSGARKASKGKRPAIKARGAREPTPIDPGLPLIVGAAVIAAGIYFDQSVLYGNAQGVWFLADAAGLFGLLLAVLGLLKLTRGRFLAALVSVAAAYTVNVYAKPLVGNEMQPEELATRTGEVVLGEGGARREFPLTNAHLLAANAEGLIRSYQVRELELRGVTTGGGDPDVRIFLDVQEAGGEDLLHVEPDMKRLLGRELKVRAQNTMQDDVSRVAVSGAERAERVVGGWAVMTEVLPFDSGSAGPPTWRVSGNLELELLGANDQRTMTRGTFAVRAVWDTF